jgi:hypothetical protein
MCINPTKKPEAWRWKRPVACVSSHTSEWQNHDDQGPLPSIVLRTELQDEVFSLVDAMTEALPLPE